MRSIIKFFPFIAIFTTLFLLFSGCDQATRDLDTQLNNSDPSTNTPIILPPTPENNTTKEPEETNTSIIPSTPEPIGDNNETNSTIKVDAKNAYKLSMTLSQSQFQRNEIGILNVTIKELYADKLVDGDIIQKIVLKTKDTRYCKFVDYTGKETTTFTLKKSDHFIDPEINIRVMMTNNSGTTEIEVTATIELPDGSTRDLYNTIPVVVIKNKTASISVNSYGTKWIKDGENAGLFVEKYIFHVVDKYGNKAKDGTYLQIGVINDPKLYTLGYSPNPAIPSNYEVINTTGTIRKDKTFTIDTTRDDISLNTNTSIDSEDNLVILPNQLRNDPAYLGGWSIEQINDAHTMTLVDDYTGNPDMGIIDMDNLTFVIGDEERFNECAHTLANAAFYFPDGAKVKDGIVYAELRYQPYMVGKSIFVYANAVIDGERIGIAREMHLVGEGLLPQSASCKNDSNVTLLSCSVSVPMNLNGYGNLARYVQPGYVVSDHSTFGSISVSNTGCSGFSTVTFYNIAPEKSATASIGDYIVWEKIINH